MTWDVAIDFQEVRQQPCAAALVTDDSLFSAFLYVNSVNNRHLFVGLLCYIMS